MRPAVIFLLPAEPETAFVHLIYVNGKSGYEFIREFPPMGLAGLRSASSSSGHPLI